MSAPGVGEVSGLHVSIEGEPSRIAIASEAVRRHLTEQGVPIRAIQRAELILDEILSNTIRYGTPPGARAVIEVSVTLRGHEIELIIADDAEPFDPTRAPEKKPAKTLESASIGGRGLSLVRRATDSMSYERRDGRNVMRFRLAV
ncbi:MAG: ATP-binding protein [Planctomycetota bacterium]